MLMPSLMSLLDRRDALGGAGNLDHHVLAADGLPQPARLFERALGVAGEIGRDFEADVAVAPFRAFVDRTQKYRRHPGCRGWREFRKRPLASRSVRGRREFSKSSYSVLPAMAFSKIVGIGSHAAQAIFVDQALQFAAGEQVAADVVQPHRLAELQEDL